MNINNQNPIVNHNPQINIPQNPKKRSRNPANWKSSLIKNAKTSGQRHVTYNGQVIPGKQFLDINCPCSVQCRNKLTQQQKQKIFQDFYSLGSHTEQNLHLRGLIFGTPGGRNRYNVNVSGTLVQVCQKYFLALHSIKSSRLRKKVTNHQAHPRDMRGRHINHLRIRQQSLTTIRNFLNGLETRESHYSRSQNVNKKYLDSSTTIASLYRRFLEQNPLLDPAIVNNRQNKTQVRFWLFEKIFNYEFNISFGYPRSDLCETCESLHVKKKLLQPNSLDLQEICLEHEEHLYEAGKFYESMKISNLSNLPANEMCICFDYQKNLPLPVTNVTAEYFLSQLWIYNFCIHDLRTGNSKMFLYSEHFAQKGCNEVISCLVYYINNFVPPNITVLRIWCDNSFAQNKNRYLLAALQSMSGNRFTEIHVKFPIPGHSRMRCDKDFGLIEKQKKKNDKFSYPSDWLKLIRDAKPSNPFQIIYVQNALTDDLADDGTSVAPVYNYKSALDPVLRPPDGINQIRGIRIDNTGTVYFVTTTYGTLEKRLVLLKNGITQQNLFTRLQVRQTGVLGQFGLLDLAYNSYLGIKPKKLINIKKLLEFVHQPGDKIFYESLEL